MVKKYNAAYKNRFLKSKSTEVYLTTVEGRHNFKDTWFFQLKTCYTCKGCLRNLSWAA